MVLGNLPLLTVANILLVGTDQSAVPVKEKGSETYIDRFLHHRKIMTATESNISCSTSSSGSCLCMYWSTLESGCSD